MKGKKIKQINNLVITKTKDKLYYAWTPINEVIYTSFDLKDIIKKCSDCKIYLKASHVKNSDLIENSDLVEKTGKELKDYISYTGYSNLKERDFVECIYHYLTKSKIARVLSISGLRGTGKTTGILQALARLNDFENTVFISINSDSKITCKQLCNLINTKYNNKKYIVIDEITRVYGMIDGLSFLADNYCMSGKKVIISGTDSLALDLVSNDSLYHRVINKNVTFISYSEVKRLLGLNISNYLEYGGLFEYDILRNVEDAYRYTQTAVVDNILNTLSKNKNSKGLLILRNIDDIVIRNAVFRILYAIVYSHYTDKVNFQRVLNCYDKREVSLYGVDVLNDLLESNLGIDSDMIIPRPVIIEILKIMERIGLVVSSNNIVNSNDKNYWITNPSLYNQLLKSINDIMGEISIKKNDKSSNSFAGLLFESVVITHTIKFGKETGLSVYFYHSDNKEIDIIVEKVSEDNRKKYFCLYVVKLQPNSDVIVATRLKWLNDITVLNEISNYGIIINRGVIYNGLSKLFNKYDDKSIYTKIENAKQKEELNKGTKFISGDSYLMDLHSELDSLLNKI